MSKKHLLLLAPLAVACVLGAVLDEWWPVALAATMIAVAVSFDLAYHPALSYQPGWAALPLGLLELGAVIGVVLALGIRAPFAVAIPLFALGWAVAQVLGHALLPLWRLSYAEDGGELGRTGALLAAAVALPLAAAVLGTWSLLICNRRWRPEQSWIDRLGRCLGIYWLGAGLVVPILRLFF